MTPVPRVREDGDRERGMTSSNSPLKSDHFKSIDRTTGRPSTGNPNKTHFKNHDVFLWGHSFSLILLLFLANVVNYVKQV